MPDMIAAFLQPNAGGLLTTSTHDTKVSEDVRARLFTLSEIPDEWSAWLREWRELNAGHKSVVGGREAPDADEEYRLYQTLLGAWPLPPGDVDDDFRERIVAYMGKALSEAKTNTSALHPDKEWENAGERFVRAILAPGGAFIQSCGKAAARLARPGMLNSLAQVILKLTAPGVPDIYQATRAGISASSIPTTAARSITSRSKNSPPKAPAAPSSNFWPTGKRAA